MTSKEIRQSFFDFFKSKGHQIVPSSSLMPDSPNLLFTNAGMNQFVPIFLGQIPCPYPAHRAADTQKCIRAGGKHNDLDDVGLDTYHHTFFEMLGNWSYGNYFKKEAITWAWELLTEVWKFPKERLYATVYSPDKTKNDPSEFDKEAYATWEAIFIAAGLDPKTHIVNGNKKDNFWMMGDTGPCGPCSEIHIDLTPKGDTMGHLVNAGSPECIEIWNLVFMELNANPDGTFSPLPAKNVDTGMGFERASSVMQCTKNFTDFSGVISNYETDIFSPIFKAIEKLSGKHYGSTLPASGSQGKTEQEKIDIAFRVIADHIRTLSFAIADGIVPGNTDRNYVLRRILRRAVRYGRTLGFTENFFYKLVDVLVDTMGDVFPEIKDRSDFVRNTIKTEEDAFNKTLDRGIKTFEDIIAIKGSLSGEDAFLLYDTYGFPLDLTELMAREHGYKVDIVVFEKLMEEQRNRARAAQKKEIVSLSELKTKDATVFLGYEKLSAQGKILEIIQSKGKWAIVLDQTPFYAEMGGQVGDSGTLTAGSKICKVLSTTKSGNIFLHFIDGEPLFVEGDIVEATVDESRRVAIERNHTATHLLHFALHEIVGQEVVQKGSFVSDDKLTFDFNHIALTDEQVHKIEQRVNELIVKNQSLSCSEVAFDSIKSNKNIMQFFGDKYGDRVRVVQVGGERSAFNGYSMELCGGTHVRSTGELGSFKIVSESAIAAGVRRIEALTGMGAYSLARKDADVLRLLSDKTKTPITDLLKRFESLAEEKTALEKQLISFRQKELAVLVNQLSKTAVDVDGIKKVVSVISVENPNELRDIAGQIVKKIGAAYVVLACVFANDRLSVAAACSSEAIAAGKNAGKLVSEICKKCDGKGGGKPDFAMGGGKNTTVIDKILAEV